MAQEAEHFNATFSGDSAAIDAKGTLIAEAVPTLVVRFENS
jgi:hypothetical protein